MKHWIQASRLRTLPLAASSILMGTALVITEKHKIIHFYFILFFCLALTFALQILANWTNDLGDGLKGTDRNRIGPKRMIETEKISIASIKKAIFILSFLIIAMLVFFLYFLPISGSVFLVFVLLGVLALIAALTYTWGKKAYGYYGFGDLMVFLFFGLLGTLGTVFLYTQAIDALYVMPATAIGLLSVAVLNANNMRDAINDRKHKKYTVAIFLGEYLSKWYQFFLIFFAFLLMVFFFSVQPYQPTIYFSLLTFIPLFFSAAWIFKNQNPALIDRTLPIIAFSTFIFVLSFLFLQIIYPKI
jgi:1,4-dihydroxy-2-naphthoate octaprenyltransferase